MASAAGFCRVVVVAARSTGPIIDSSSGPDADRGPRRGPDHGGAAGSGGQVLVDEVPVDEVVEDDVDELRSSVAVVDVVGVLPDVDRPERLLTVLEGKVGVGRLGHLELAAVVDQPSPAGAELGDAGLRDLGAELVVGAEVCGDAIGDRTGGGAAAVRGEAVPEEGVVPDLRRVVEQRAVGLEDDVL